MATIKDIARHVGVSTSTVSHVLNKTRFVSEEISERVMAAAKSLNYTPSALARSLKVNHTKTFGMLVTTSTNPFFGEVVKGVERRCYEKGYNLILCNTEGDAERVHSSLDTLLQKRVDGLLLMCTEIEDQVLELFSRYPAVPTVVMDWGLIDFPSDKIQDNSHHGGYLATKFLIEQGHTDIGCLTGPLNKRQAQQRLSGFAQAMEESGVAINKEWIASGDFECEGGEAAFNELHSRGKLPSALFVCNDMMAMGVINCANKKGISVPNDLSIVGYDDIKMAKYITPSLTTIHQPKHRLGQQAVDSLLEKIQTKSETNHVIQLEPTLVVRDSVKPIIA
ncbi:LacI family DNA-binding transcriptional regulator [Aliivibrio finisterrensis]|uniref:substrate-binding domain-containing protein n=1 Tax=Aliivibrio finisterrensis TaxID=511998 RepID=UPI001022873B|nr:substrate-binding domain-containing protein [Aliivibrio finisterrensis]RYU68794.1 LacI family DNA-binding transcriptional regulator [Aliivibrio finisterrensis]RYU72800.1 LacI family DNA-binding transcriptional regulator [Aliivibrio finisterrensis]RYU75207.1 LacI family DNA-binding transcriptional regulator [Aliivibrio finisterrensis]